jgi:hypothetical protein
MSQFATLARAHAPSARDAACIITVTTPAGARNLNAPNCLRGKGRAHAKRTPNGATRFPLCLYQQRTRAMARRSVAVPMPFPMQRQQHTYNYMLGKNNQHRAAFH